MSVLPEPVEKGQKITAVSRLVVNVQDRRSVNVAAGYTLPENPAGMVDLGLSLYLGDVIQVIDESIVWVADFSRILGGRDRARLAWYPLDNPRSRVVVESVKVAKVKKQVVFVPAVA